MTNDKSPLQEFFKEESDKKTEVSWIMLKFSFLPCCLLQDGDKSSSQYVKEKER